MHTVYAHANILKYKSIYLINKLMKEICMYYLY